MTIEQALDAILIELREIRAQLRPLPDAPTPPAPWFIGLKGTARAVTFGSALDEGDNTDCLTANPERTNPPMTHTRVMEYFSGSPTQAAVALGVSRQHVDNWRRTPRIPTIWQLKLERLTAGALQADEQAKEEGREIASYVPAEPARSA